MADAAATTSTNGWAGPTRLWSLGAAVNGVIHKRPLHRQSAPARTKPCAFSIYIGTAAGKRRKVRRPEFATKRGATAAMHAEIGQGQSGSHVEPSILTVRAFLVKQRPPGLTEIRPPTVRGDRGNIEFYLDPALSRTRLSALATPMINRLYAGLRGVTAIYEWTQLRGHRDCTGGCRLSCQARSPFRPILRPLSTDPLCAFGAAQSSVAQGARLTLASCFHTLVSPISRAAGLRGGTVRVARRTAVRNRVGGRGPGCSGRCTTC